MRLSQYAKQIGIHYKTAWRWFKEGKIAGYQMDTGTVIVTEAGAPPATTVSAGKTVIYSRVSAAENKTNLDSQAERLVGYCAAKGYQVNQVVKEIGSGVNDQRPKLLRLLSDPSVTRIVVEHKDRLTRFGFHYLETLLRTQGRVIEVVNPAADGKEDLVQDFVAVITSFCARLYGRRRAKRKTEKLIAQLEADDATD